MDSLLLGIAAGVVAVLIAGAYGIHLGFKYCADAAITIPAPHWWINDMDKATMRRMVKQQHRADRNHA